MTTRAASSAALPLAHLALRILIVVNWLAAVLITVLLVGMPTSRWIRSALHLPSTPDSDWVVIGLQAIAFFGLVGIPLNYMILKRLLAMVDTVRAGDPFVESNAARLQTIAWAMTGLQILSLIIGGIARAITSPEIPLRITAGFSASGWLAVLLTFLLARVFEEGTAMRDDLKGTV